VDWVAALDGEVCNDGARISRAGTPSGGSAGSGTAVIGSRSSATGVDRTASDAPVVAAPAAACDEVE
jgi:hypothetical protein